MASGGIKKEGNMYENSVWIDGKAKEKIRNHSIVIYHENGELTNLKNREEIAVNMFVFVDEIVPEPVKEQCIFNEGSHLRCLRVHILA